MRLRSPDRRDRGDCSAELVDLTGRRAGVERVAIAHDDAAIARGQVEDVVRVPHDHRPGVTLAVLGGLGLHLVLEGVNLGGDEGDERVRVTPRQLRQLRTELDL